MFYAAILDKKSMVFHKNFWSVRPSDLEKILPGVENPSDIVSLYETDRERHFQLFADFRNKKAICGYFG
jgi:hypothetical protein